nr:hypothetical protein NG677_02350 [Methylobacterium sp. OTU13CASTA1]
MDANSVTGAQENIQDFDLVNRIIDAYVLAVETDFGRNFWVEVFGPMKAPIHDAIVARDHAAVTQLLREPHSNMLFEGFEILKQDFPNFADFKALNASTAYDALLVFAEAIGALRLEYPEGYQLNQVPPNPIAVEDVLSALDRMLGLKLEFPNPYPNENGLVTERGIVSYRAVQSAYQGYRIASLAREYGGCVAEIGGGLGRTAFYSRLFGVRDYSIVDIPMSSVAQSYFLGRTLGDQALRLFGETPRASMNLIPPSEFFSDGRFYGLIVNVDSLPEISGEMSDQYITHISSHTTRFLSINHEVAVHSHKTVRDVALANKGRSLSRTPYWLRRGYVDELFAF